ncbi:PREDICTED: protein ENHANCED DOWNY MILDEW 2 isoform X2 [Nelumbo nucifera]|uniref:Protein ENHANCED DOWNY MILDEW 2 isoform X2 n=1 Tax=Nelumbo nucifera TaxID=4432 RepID=A0A1U7ZHX7_NELNU|nr:PREDICTED: protein ENHANCED DOWNY MILDEW 2 isoform X2 [Nelumbo nucifera]
MASSDDEDEVVPQSVANYHFVDAKDEPISFSVLPIQWDKDESADDIKQHIFLHGTADGLQKIYKQVTAWKFDLSHGQPEISVLTKERNWIKLQKPRKSFEDTIRTTMITVHCLHYVRKNPEASGKSVWEHLCKVFISYDLRPSENDLLDQVPLISVASQRDEVLAKSKFLLGFLEEKPRKKTAFNEDFLVPSDTKNPFIVDDEEESEGDLFDSVCAICDNGGELLCCEGRCFRSFHATVEAGAESVCESLGFSNEQVDAIQNFRCKNCQFNKHQCFACGKLGSSGKSSGSEVFCCANATCGHFYHPECVAKLLHKGNKAAAEELQEVIASGKSFTCPVHKCFVCKERENKDDPELQLAVCRRCPTSYHRKCLPREIAFEDSEDDDIIQRAWEDLLPNRILIYCLKHDIDEELGTPIRNHIIFPDVEVKKKKHPSELQSTKEKFVVKRGLVLQDATREGTTVKTPKVSAVKDRDSSKKGQGFDFSKIPKTTDASRNTSKDNLKPVSMKLDRSQTVDESKISSGEEKLKSVLNKELKHVKPNQQDTQKATKFGETTTTKPVLKKSVSSLFSLDAEAEKRILDLMKSSSSSISLEKIMQKHKAPSTHAYSSRNIVDKTITMGKVEGSVEAVRTALQKLEEGCSLEDVKDVCEPEILVQIIKWKNKLRVYLAPFLYGMRYTSFGRHFTKVDKLKEIVDKLHWYVQNGDMIVDFCCGANDFSCLMKEKLEGTGKRCSFKNFDVIQPKNDFNFERRDWMTVRPSELPTGSQLIMGLNPPFGVKAALANKFIDKALEFKPKLLVLIVPPETERPGKKRTPYDLIWEDVEKLSGKSFYLPGSIDVNYKQIDQWNTTTPVLYLWSRPDWTSKHMNIAEKHGHTSTKQRELHMDENHDESQVSEHPKEKNHDYYNDISKTNNEVNGISREINDVAEQNAETEDEETRTVIPQEMRGSSPVECNIGANQDLCDDSETESRKHHGRRKKRSRESPKERRDLGKKSKVKIDTSPERKYDEGRPHTSKAYKETSEMGSPQGKRTDPRNSEEGQPSETLEISPERVANEEGSRHFQTTLPVSTPEFGVGYRGTPTSIPDVDIEEIERRYSSNRGDPFVGGNHNWMAGSNLGQEVRGLGEQFPGRIQDNMEALSHKPYFDELEEKYRREDVRMQLHYGRQDFDSLSHRSSYLGGQDSMLGGIGSLSSAPYGIMGASGESSYQRMNLPATQRYMPRLDELNHTRIGNFGPEIPLVGRSGVYDLPGSRPSFRADSLGFAPGPQHPFSHHNSSGWLNE